MLNEMTTAMRSDDEKPDKSPVPKPSKELQMDWIQESLEILQREDFTQKIAETFKRLGYSTKLDGSGDSQMSARIAEVWRRLICTNVEKRF